MAKPVRNRDQMLAFVNGLRRPIHQTESLLLVGLKGTFKSTFLWLLGKGEKPNQTMKDGTVEIQQVGNFVDSIGLKGWGVEEVLKLMVLMVYDGIPKDLIVFGNDRVDMPVTTLGLLGIRSSMIVIMHSSFWNEYCRTRPRIELVKDANGVLKVQPESNLDLIYNLAAYKRIVDLQLGTPITHHDDIAELVNRRRGAIARPFDHLLTKLGQTFTVNMENNNLVEMLFRFVYIFEKQYKKDALSFMNEATMQDFQSLADLPV